MFLAMYNPVFILSVKSLKCHTVSLNMEDYDILSKNLLKCVICETSNMNIAL
jgi:hypothetical protein